MLLINFPFLGTLLGVYVVFRRNKKKMADLVNNPRMRSAAMMGFKALLLGTGARFIDTVHFIFSPLIYNQGYAGDPLLE